MYGNRYCPIHFHYLTLVQLGMVIIQILYLMLKATVVTCPTYQWRRYGGADRQRGEATYLPTALDSLGSSRDFVQIPVSCESELNPVARHQNFSPTRSPPTIAVIFCVLCKRFHLYTLTMGWGWGVRTTIEKLPCVFFNAYKMFSEW